MLRPAGRLESRAGRIKGGGRSRRSQRFFRADPGGWGQRRLRMARQLNVKLLTGELHSVDSSACTTVWDFKMQARHKTGVSPYQQKLACQKSRLELRDAAPLSEYGLQTGDTLLLVVKTEESIPIFLRNPNGRTSTYHVLPSDAVSQFRARVQQQENVQGDQFWLCYEGQTLEDGRKLSDYSITPHGIVSLNLRLRGGVLSLCG